MPDSLSFQTAFVTGATGMVGSHLVEHLLAGGVRPRCLVRATSDTSLLDSLDVLFLPEGYQAQDYADFHARRNMVRFAAGGKSMATMRDFHVHDMVAVQRE